MLYLDNHTDKEFFKSRTTKLLVPSTIGLFAFQFIQGYFNTRLSNAMNKYSWGLYVFHYLGISIIAVCIAQKGILPFPVVYLISLISAFVLAFILYELISRLPFFRWAVLGIKK